MKTGKEISKSLSEFCLLHRTKVLNEPQKVRSAKNYSLDILEEAIDLLEIIEDEDFLEKFTNYWHKFLKQCN